MSEHGLHGGNGGTQHAQFTARVPFGESVLILILFLSVRPNVILAFLG